MIIIGIYDDHNCSAALSIDGKIVFAAQEERFTGQKNEVGFPVNVVDHIFSAFNLTADMVDEMAFATIDRSDFVELKYKRDIRFRVKDHWEYMDEYWTPRLAGEPYDKRYVENKLKEFASESFYTFGDDLYDLEGEALKLRVNEIVADDIFKRYGLGKNKIVFYDHHTCHVTYGLFSNPNPNKESIVVTIDAFGDGRNQTVWKYANNKLEILAESKECELARVYRFATLAMGMQPLEHEYKVMGLAPYAKEEYVENVYRELVRLTEVKDMSFRHLDRPKNLFNFLREKFRHYRFDNIAGGVQLYIERSVAELFKDIHNHTGISDFVFSGGVAMNIKANFTLVQEDFVDSLFVCGSSSDESLSIGACYLANYEKDIDNKPLDTLYLGDDLTTGEVEAYVASHGLDKRYNVSRVNNKAIARILADGEVVARVDGRMEFGARSLGNRSILADPSQPGVVKVINEMIKNRDFWMPFAATVMDRDCDKYLYNPKNVDGRYMSMAFQAKHENIHEVFSGTHPYDETMRPQILTEQQNAKYYDLINEFSNLTGIGALLNTSLNLHGLPLARSIKDAIYVFENSGLKYLVVADYMISK
jgi:carbamoyltransferase